jgi:hypothetical protein
MNMFYRKDPEDILAERKLADEVLCEKWADRGVAIYEDGPMEAQTWGIGHCHIDAQMNCTRMNLTNEDQGSGRTTSPNPTEGRALTLSAHGRHRSTSWAATQNTNL